MKAVSQLRTVSSVSVVGKLRARIGGFDDGLKHVRGSRKALWMTRLKRKA